MANKRTTGDIDGSTGTELIEIDLDFASMRRFQAQFSPNLSKEGLFIDTGEPLSPGSVVRFRVILPEDFVFLEGTAVVEWIRPAEASADGAPGMALRFAALSPQNQELVEQLVQDYVNQGGTPFDLDGRPGSADLPTDAIEGPEVPEAAPPTESSVEPAEESFRVTIRGDSPAPDEIAMQVLGGVGPAEDAIPGPSAAGPDEAAQQGFDIVGGSSPVEDQASDEAIAFDEIPSASETAMGDQAPPAEEIPVDDEAIAMDEVGDGSSIDWVDAAVADGGVPDAAGEPDLDQAPPAASFDDPPELELDDEPDEPAPAVAAPEPAVPGQGATASLFASQPDARDAVGDVRGARHEAEVVVPEPAFLSSPPEFDDGPEFLDDVPDVGPVGGTPFDVSLPVPDDGPDTTPVLPDEGRADVTIASGDDSTVVRAPRRRVSGRLLGLLALAAVVVAAVLLWPKVSVWLAERELVRSAAIEDEVADDSVPSPAAVEATGVEEGGGETEPVSEAGGHDDESAGTTAAVEPAEAGQGDAATESAPATEPPPDEAGLREAIEGGSGAAASQDEVGRPTTDEAMIDTSAGAGAGSELAPATAVTNIRYAIRGAGTGVIIDANGSLEDGAIALWNLPNPPRLVVRIIGITEVYRPYEIEAGTAELQRLRIGHHEERRPPELWIVLDVTDTSIEVVNVAIKGRTAELLLASR